MVQELLQIRRRTGVEIDAARVEDPRVGEIESRSQAFGTDEAVLDAEGAPVTATPSEAVVPPAVDCATHALRGAYGGRFHAVDAACAKVEAVEIVAVAESTVPSLTWKLKLSVPVKSAFG